MNVSRGNAARAMVGAVILGVFAFVALVQFAPDSVAFSPNNYGWNGLRDVATTYNVNFTTDISIVPSNSTLVLAQPVLNYSGSYVSSVRSFLEKGGTVLLAAKSPFADSLLAGLGSGISIESEYLVNDQTYNWKSSSVPTALVLPAAKSEFKFLANVSGIALNEPAPLVTGAGVVQLAVTSQFSTSSAPGSPKGPFVVAAAQKFGKGTLVVIGAPQFLLNSEWNEADNGALIRNLFANTQVFIDASHWGMSSVASLKGELAQVYAFVSPSPMRYIVTFFAAEGALAFVPSRGPRPAVPRPGSEEGPAPWEGAKSE